MIGWGWYYLSTILDDYSHYIIAWKLCSTMRADDVTDTIGRALGLQAAAARRSCTNLDCSATMARVTSRAISPNGSRIAAWQTFAARRAIRRPSKIERWHQTLKNRILLENYYLPGDPEARSRASSSTTITGVTRKAYGT
jgi:transposase InsO family protein